MPPIMRIDIQRRDGGVVEIKVYIGEVAVLDMPINELGRILWRAPPGFELGPVMLNEVWVSLAKDTQFEVERTEDGIVAVPRT